MNPDSNALSDMLGSVLSNPEAMSSIMRVASSLGLGGAGLGGLTASTPTENAREESSEALSRPEPQRTGEGQTAQSPIQSAPTPAAPAQKKSNGDDDRIRLLNALRPYLGDDRRKKVDSVLGILRLLRAAEESGLLRDGLNLGGLFPSGGK